MYGMLKCIRLTVTPEELVLSGAYQCTVSHEGNLSVIGFRDLDTCHCMGGPRNVSRSLDCCKALS